MTEVLAADEALDVHQLLDGLATIGISLWLDDAQVRYRAPKGVMTPERLELLRRHREQIAAALAGAAGPAPARHDPAGRHQPFPLTDVQSAYLVGRSGAYAYGGVGCHGYGELRFDDVDPVRLQLAWTAVVHRHDMLHAVIAPDGTQQVPPEPRPYTIQVEDLRGEPADRFTAAVQTTRAAMDHQVYQPGSWPMFDLRLTRHDHEAILHFSIDFLIADFVSLQVILTDLEQQYREPALTHAQAEQPVEPGITFRDALLAIRSARSGPQFERDRAYWSDRLSDLPERPDLPVQPAADAPPRFERHQLALSAPDWAGLRERARAVGLTPSTAVLAAYAEVLARWSRAPQFTVNVTVLSRPPIHPDIDRVVGDFTSVELLAVSADFGVPFRRRAAALQETLWEDLDHGSYTGIDVIRQLRRQHPARQDLYPVVFTSSIGLRRDGGRTDTPPSAGPVAAPAARSGLERLVRGISQTPQVWLDCQAMELAGGLSVNWDVRRGVFPDGLVEAMFAAFEELLCRLAREDPERDDSVWQASCPVPVPAPQSAARPHLAPAQPEGHDAALLHRRVIDQARRTPEGVAVISGDRSTTYRELLRSAAAVAHALAGQEAGGGVVAVEMDKGWEQIAGVLGILWAGHAYVPVDPGQPLARRNRILADVGARHLLTQSWLGDGAARGGIRCIAVDQLAGIDQPAESAVHDDGLAYVIYTSGSTGSPKGVMISHRAAWNTIAEINARFHVGAQDRVLGLSNLGFDLSVYDIFGPLSVGGCLVLPESGRRGDPARWAEIIAGHQVTIWNSVPSQMEMLTAYLHSEPHLTLPDLRLALLSGDWIPVGLPPAIWRLLPGTDVVSLGGATEASIWSIVHPIRSSDTPARSIPYGRQLAGQSVEVLGPALVELPDLVTGELYIGGAGLALGYFGDAARTAERFIHHPGDGRRLYRTGDLGRYLPDGSIEFLGREDAQVKIRGYRVELAEIEAALTSHPAVGAAAVVAVGRRPDPLRLAAFIEPAARSTAASETRPGGDEAAELADLAIDEAATLRAAVDTDQLLAYAQELDATALLQMMSALRQCGLFTHDGDAHAVPEILDRGGIAPRHHRLVRRWVQVLAENGMLHADPITGALSAAGRGAANRTGAADIAAGWQRVHELTPDVERRTELIGYFATAADRLPELLRGRLDPLELLFPQGRTEIHENAYNGMFLSRYVNRLLVSAACELARRHRGPEPLRVLEVGSGVGGTSVELIPALADFDVEYVFSDVSEFFLNNARERFREYRWIDYRQFDLNADFRAQGLASNSYDLVVCANVLHYAKNVDTALGRLRELLRPGGWVLFIEATRDSYQIMTSMEFLFDEGSGEFDDVRRAREQTFLTHQQWLDVLAASGADGVFAVPRQDPITDTMGMHVFGARFKSDREAVRRNDLAAHLAEQLPAYMLPSRVEVVDRLPVTSNGKIDRAALRSWLDAGATAPAAVDEPPVGLLEQQIGEVWQRLLRVEQVGRRQNFFELGGDSLLAAQVAAQLREKLPAAVSLYYDNLLRLLLENATVEGLAAQIDAAQQAAPTVVQERSPLVELGEGDGATVVLIHDETGELAGYRGLLDAVGGGVRLAGLRVADRDGYLATAPDALVDQIATDYARVLAQAGHTRVRLVGQYFGGIVAAELARQLAELGVAVERLVVVAAGEPPWPVDDEYVAEYLLYGALGIAPEPLGFPAGDGIPGRTPRWAAALPALRAEPVSERLLRSGAEPPAAELFEVFRHSCAGTRFGLLPYAGDIDIVRPASGLAPWPGVAEDMHAYWADVCLGTVRTIDLTGGYLTAGAEAAGLLPGLLGGDRP
jgi:pyochelin synthetase